MIKHLLLGLSFLLLACQQAMIPASAPARLRLQAAGTSVQTPSGGTLSGNFRLHPQLASRYLKYSRDVLVWLPPGYEREPQRRYPVLYMHDGNNLFDRRSSFGGSEWEVDEHAGQLIARGTIEPVIIVGVYNSPGRMDEYTWYPGDVDGQVMGGQGANYARFLVEELKPLIDKSYRTQADREHTAVMGSSLGGQISFYLGLNYPQVYGQIGLMSPSIWWKDRAMIKDVVKVPKNLRIWVDMGTHEGQEPETMLQDAKDLVQGLEKQGYQHFKNLAFHVAPGAGHNEQAWAARIERPLQFFFSRQPAVVTR
ncbi:MAG: alpha/beta hydrolase [Candidatus Sericytochromatia bacterium]